MFPKLDIKQYFEIHGRGKPTEEEEIVRRRRYRKKFFDELNSYRNKKKKSKSIVATYDEGLVASKREDRVTIKPRYNLPIQSPDLGIVGMKTNRRDY